MTFYIKHISVICVLFIIYFLCTSADLANKRVHKSHKAHNTLKPSSQSSYLTECTVTVAVVKWFPLHSSNTAPTSYTQCLCYTLSQHVHCVSDWHTHKDWAPSIKWVLPTDQLTAGGRTGRTWLAVVLTLKHLRLYAVWAHHGLHCLDTVNSQTGFMAS